MSGLFIHKIELIRNTQTQNETGGIETQSTKAGEFWGYIKDGKAKLSKSGDDTGAYYLSSTVLADGGSVDELGGLVSGDSLRHGLTTYKVVNAFPKGMTGVIQINLVRKL